MEYVVGSIVTIITMVSAYYAISKIKLSNKPVRITNSQSLYFSLMLPFMDSEGHKYRGNFADMPKTQASEYTKKTSIKLIFHEDDVYWIDNGMFYTAKANNGEIDQQTKKIVDTMTVDSVELKKLSSIVEMLTEGADRDSGNSGH